MSRYKPDDLKAAIAMFDESRRKFKEPATSEVIDALDRHIDAATTLNTAAATIIEHFNVNNKDARILMFAAAVAAFDGLDMSERIN